MRRVLVYCDHMSDIWRNRIGKRVNLPEILESGTRAYALKQSNMWNRLALKYAGIWYRHLTVFKIVVEWSEQYVSAGISAAALHSGKKSTFLARLRVHDALNAHSVPELMDHSRALAGSSNPSVYDLRDLESVPSALLDDL